MSLLANIQAALQAVAADIKGLTASVSARGRTVITAAQATISGSAVDFVSIPSWAKEITVVFGYVSLSGTSNLRVQIGSSSGFESTGYTSVSANIQNSIVLLTSSSGFDWYVNYGPESLTGTMRLTNVGGNLWVCDGVAATSTPGVNVSLTIGGGKSLSAVLDRVRITSSGADTLDSGSVLLIIKG